MQHALPQLTTRKKDAVRHSTHHHFLPLIISLLRTLLFLSFLIAAASASWSTYSDSELEATVTALIDAGTCASVSSNSNCGSNATGFYYSFEYNGSRIVISSGAPDHRAEYDQEVTNPNTRCKLNLVASIMNT